MASAHYTFRNVTSTPSRHIKESSRIPMNDHMLNYLAQFRTCSIGKENINCAKKGELSWKRSTPVSQEIKWESFAGRRIKTRVTIVHKTD